MSRARIAVLAGILLALGGALAVIYVIWDRAQPPPPPARLDPAAATQRAAERSAIEPANAAPPPAGGTAAYAEATVALGNSEAIARFLFDLHGSAPETAILLARATAGSQAFAPVPVMIAARPAAVPGDKKDKANSPSIRIPFALTSGTETKEFTAPFALAEGGKLTIAFEVAYVKAADADAAAIEAIALARELGHGLPLVAGAGGDAFSTKAGRFRETFVQNAPERLERVLAVDLELAAPARRIALKDSANKSIGAITVALALRGPMIANGNLDYRRAAALAVGPERRVGPYLVRQGGLATAIITGTAPEAQSACAQLTKALGTDLGLAAVDAARIVATLARTRATFGAPVPTGACGTAMNAESTGAAPGAKQEAESQALLRLSGALRHSPPRKGADPVTGMLAETAALVDLSGLWLTPGDAGVLAGERSRVQPAIDAAGATDALRALPVGRMACFGAGRTEAAHRRAALLELRGDKGLWHLELAFDAAGKISGVAFDGASQGDFCRLAIRRRPDSGACVFTPVRYPGIDPKRC